MNSFGRFFHVSSTLLPLSIAYVFSKNSPQSKKFLQTTIHIREAFQKLGPTYIKLGQMLSSRPDIIGPELSSELRNLLDKEPAVPFSQVKAILDAQLKASYQTIFSIFDETPIATASIAQVHKAKLHNGRNVAVKVQRPDIDQLFQNDLQVLKPLSSLLDFFFAKGGIRFSYIYKEFAGWIGSELDFQVEGRRADTFKENMAPVDGVTIPTVYWKYTTQKVLTMEFLEGITLNNLLDEMKKQQVTSLYELKTVFKINPDLLIKRTLAAIAKQAFKDRFFHGDLHPANIIVQKNNTVAFVDFGIIGTLDNKEYMELVFVMLSLVEDDPESLSKAILALVTQSLTKEQITAIQELISDELHKLHEDTNGKISLNHFITVLLSLAHQYNMFWSPGTLLAVKTIGQIDFVAGQIGLRQPLVTLMKPEIEKYVTNAISSQISKETLYKTLLGLFETGKKLPDTLEQLEHLITSGKLVEVTTALGAKTGSLTGFVLPAGGAALISLPILTSSYVADSPYKTVLFILVPLLLFVIIGKIFDKQGGR